ncbi:MAG: NAD(P)H-dependent oxidoreductase [Kordiimonadaceae bacterium]|jgi:chromate reductase, NAD(P)H dehydrogenase (quinone)|nr:NAD(P)H-dependent oxidoreductase [Kordiimonadaceae bacterium]MBT6031189.1 NAD(P)H-dependent oxidoreductase [Kordiimonadaceae bacterium]
MSKILFFAGSARKNSFNKKLAKAAYNIASKKDIEATFIDLRDYPMPLYDGDLEDDIGLPENAAKLKTLFAEQDGFFIATPEYNSSLPPLLKNTIDWISRPNPNTPDMADPYKGKTAAIAASSPGGLGGMRVLVPLRMLLGNIGIHVMPTQVSVNFVSKSFDENGNLINENQLGLLHATIDELIQTTNALKT